MCPSRLGEAVLAGRCMNTSNPVLRIAYLYPDLMNLYADRGNLVCLQRRCEWRGILTDVQRLEWGGTLQGGADLYVIGGGQDRQQKLASVGLAGPVADQILSDLGDGAAMLSVCGGYQLMARSYRAADGDVMAGLGVFDAETVHPGDGVARCVGNVVCDWNDSTLVGFENHGGRTYLGAHIAALATVRVGHGNNSEDGTEGAVMGSAIGTYLHGSVLPKNPHLADHVIGLALARVAPEFQLDVMRDAEEWEAHRAALRVAGVDSPLSDGFSQRGGARG
jgi:CobQ-like glutamine amidotransferase family enzyme